MAIESIVCPSSSLGLTSLLGVILGFTLSEIRNWLSNTKKHNACRSALKAEIEFAKSRAQMLIDDKIEAPLYRLPTKAFENCFPELLAGGVLSENQSIALMNFFAEIETLNRGLDFAADATSELKRKEHYERNKLKAQRLTAEAPTYIAAASAINKD